MSDEETVAAVRANYEHGRGATFEQTEVLFRALDAAEARAAELEARLGMCEARLEATERGYDVVRDERDALRTRLALAEKVVKAAKYFREASDTHSRDALDNALAALDAHTKANP